MFIKILFKNLSLISSFATLLSIYITNHYRSHHGSQ